MHNPQYHVHTSINMLANMIVSIHFELKYVATRAFEQVVL